MKLILIYLLFLFLLANSSISVHAENLVKSNTVANSSVVIQNNVNASSTTNSSKNTTTTKIDINQSGQGTSTVIVNGKEYKVEGTGSIKVDETNGKSNITLTISPTVIPLSPTSTPIPTLDSNEPSKTDNPMQRVFEMIRKMFSRFFSL